MKTGRFKYPFRILFFAYILLLFKLVVFKGNLAELQQHFSSAVGSSPIHPIPPNLIPFRTLYYYISMQEPFDVAMRNIVGNILLFIPFGLLLPAVSRIFTAPGKMLLLALLTSLVLEASQFLFRLGGFDVDDIILNLLGSSIGFLLFRFGSILVKSR